MVTSKKQNLSVVKFSFHLKSNIFATTLNSAYNEVTFNEKLAITKENLCTKYTPFTYKYIALNEKPPIMKQNLCIFFFVIGRVECINHTEVGLVLFCRAGAGLQNKV